MFALAKLSGSWEQEGEVVELAADGNCVEEDEQEENLAEADGDEGK